MKAHIFYNGERCQYCHVNIYDERIYGPNECVERETIRYRTETPSR